MENRLKKINVSAPGRICLFGEHQDYLNLPVIPAAISLRISIVGNRRNEKKITIQLADIGKQESFVLMNDLPYIKERDYFRSAVNVLQRERFTFTTGFDCTVKGDIPINAGTSSSSALIVAWVNFLLKMSEQSPDLTPEQIAQYAYKAEVLEFSEPGGMMDHYSSAMGNVIFLDFTPEIRYEPVSIRLKSFVLGDSLEPKNTHFILSRVKNKVIHITQLLKLKYPGFSLHTTAIDEIDRYSKDLTVQQQQLLKGTLYNYEITKEAKYVLQQEPLDHKRIGELLNEHQKILRDVLQISTPKIDRMIDAALKAGAYGAKINGSGGGGCMFAYAPENPGAVKQAIERVGGKGFIIHIDHGVSVQTIAD